MNPNSGCSPLSSHIDNKTPGVLLFIEGWGLTGWYNRTVMKQIINYFADWFTFRRWAAVPVRIKK
jgi:hypothetical protein